MSDSQQNIHFDMILFTLLIYSNLSAVIYFKVSFFRLLLIFII